jgi:hypothetical protein
MPGACRSRRPAWRKGSPAQLLRRRRRCRAGRAAAVPQAAGAHPAGHIPFTPRAKKSLEHSWREAKARHDNHIGVEHLTLALVAMTDGAVPPILAGLGASQAMLRAAILDATGRPADPPATGTSARRSSLSFSLASSPSHSQLAAGPRRPSRRGQHQADSRSAPCSGASPAGHHRPDGRSEHTIEPTSHVFDPADPRRSGRADVQRGRPAVALEAQVKKMAAGRGPSISCRRSAWRFRGGAALGWRADGQVTALALVANRKVAS